MMFKNKVAAAVLALMAAGVAQAQTAPEPNYTLSYNAGVVSQYRFRGIEQTSGNPAVQLGADFAHKNGLYAGVWTSNVTWVREVNGASSGEREVDYYFGFKSPLAADVTMDVGFIRYDYPGNNSGAAGTPAVLAGSTSYVNASTNETYVALTWGLATLKMNNALGDFLGNYSSSGSSYWELALNFDLGNGYTFVPHVGRQKVANQTLGTNTTAADYNDYSLTLNKDFGKGLSASVAAIGTNAGSFYVANYNGQSNRYLGGNTVVVGAKYSF